MRAAQAQEGDLATAVPDRAEFAVAVGIAFISLAALVLTAPFANRPLTRVEAFVPAYESALSISFLITSVLLFAQFSRARSVAILLLACAYLFNASIVVPHALTFPGVFSATGLLGAGTQTTSWLYCFWHGGFALFLVAFAALRRIAPRRALSRGRPAGVRLCGRHFDRGRRAHAAVDPGRGLSADDRGERRLFDADVEGDQPRHLCAVRRRAGPVVAATARERAGSVADRRRHRLVLRRHAGGGRRGGALRSGLVRRSVVWIARHGGAAGSVARRVQPAGQATQPANGGAARFRGTPAGVFRTFVGMFRRAGTQGQRRVPLCGSQRGDPRALWHDACGGRRPHDPGSARRNPGPAHRRLPQRQPAVALAATIRTRARSPNRRGAGDPRSRWRDADPAGHRQRPRHHRAPVFGGPATPVAEIGGRRPVDRRDRARLQQYAGDRHGLARSRAAPAGRRVAGGDRQMDRKRP